MILHARNNQLLLDVTYHARTGFRRCGTSLPQLSSGPLGGCIQTSTMTKRSIKQSLQFFSILVIILSAQAQAQDTWYLNPGFKIGYAFGQNGGIIGGFEVSLTHLPKSGILLTGACVSVEKFKSTLLIHLGFEAASIVGASLGPTMMISEENRSFGFHSYSLGWHRNSTIFQIFIIFHWIRHL